MPLLTLPLHDQTQPILSSSTNTNTARSQVSISAFASAPKTQTLDGIPSCMSSLLVNSTTSATVTAVGGFHFVGAEESSVLSPLVDEPILGKRLIPVGAWANQRLIALLPFSATASAAAVIAAAPGASTLRMAGMTPTPPLIKNPYNQPNEVIKTFTESLRPTSAALVAQLLSAPAWRFAEAGDVETNFVKSTRHKASFASQ